MVRLCITGTPGTGKTYFAKRLSKRLNLEYIDLNLLIKRHKLYDSYDRVMRSYIVDIDKLTRFIKVWIKSHKDFILDSHMSHLLPANLFDLCIVKSIPLKTLKSRLNHRNYLTKKVRENLDAEIFEVCKTEALEKGHKIYEVPDNLLLIHYKSIKYLLNFY
jgi:adenylate kinase